MNITAHKSPAATGVDPRSPAQAHVGTLARVAYGFVRNQVDSVMALAALLRGRHRRSESEEEERW